MSWKRSDDDKDSLSSTASKPTVVDNRFIAQSQKSDSLTETQPTLAQILAENIKASGPLSVSTYMTTALLDPAYGYYSSSKDGKIDGSGRDVLGSRGDFITSPEISQVFGELLAVYFISRYHENHSPEKVRLVELGPGRGTLLSDMLRTFKIDPKLLDSISKIHLVETSAGLMQLQHDALSKVLEQAGKKLVGPYTPMDQGGVKEERKENEIEVEWFPRVEGVPIENDSYTILVAHEFFDALPTHIFEKTPQGFREVLVDVKREKQGQSGVTVLKPSEMTFSSQAKENKSSSITSTTSTSSSLKPTFQYVLSPRPTPWTDLLASRSQRFKHLKDGQRVEISPESWAAARRIGELISGTKAKPNPISEIDYERMSGSEKDELKIKEIKRLKDGSNGGAALIVDYGDEKAFGASFRAFKNHKIVDPLENPGTADLTANVDFLHLKSAIQTTGAIPLPILSQSHFLQRLGLQPRIENLIKHAQSDERRRNLESGSKRLIDPTGMGSQYKVMGLEAKKREKGQSDEIDEIDDGNSMNPVYPFQLDEEGV